MFACRFDQNGVNKCIGPYITALHLIKERENFIIGTNLGVEFEHGGEDKDIGVGGEFENEMGVGWRSLEARAVVDKLSPVTLVVERADD